DGDTAASGLRSFAARVLEPAIYPIRAPLAAAVLQTPDRIHVDEARRGPFTPVALGWRWGPVWSTAWFRVMGTVPESMRGRRVVLRFSTGTEALLWDDQTPAQGLDANRDAALLFDPARAGEPIDLMIEAACNHPLGAATTGLFWEPPEF